MKKDIAVTEDLATQNLTKKSDGSLITVRLGPNVVQRLLIFVLRIRFRVINR